MTKCGFISVIGAPNAGKSTLINQLVGQKVSIVSPKVQTTRQRILGVLIQGESQIILVDTPGIFTSPKRRLEKAMVQSAWSSLQDTDGIIIIVDANRKDFNETEKIIDALNRRKEKITLALNKIDLIPKEKLLELAHRFSKPFIDEIFMISALKGKGVEAIKSYWSHHLPQGPWLFPKDQVSDLPLRLLAAEITREEIFHRLHQELPYEIWVETQGWEEFKNGSVKVMQSIFVRRESQRSIVLGKGGAQVKKIGEAARGQLTKILKRPVHLFLHVKVKTKWIDDPRLYASIGLDFQKD